MKHHDLKERFKELRDRCENLPPEAQARAIEGCLEVVTLCELPAEPGESLKIVVSLDRDSEITHLSG